VVYPEDHALWVQVTLTAKARFGVRKLDIDNVRTADARHLPDDYEQLTAGFVARTACTLANIPH